MKKYWILSIGFSVVMSAGVQAQLKLSEAFAQGKVCERPDGYIQSVSGYEGETADLVGYVNNARRKEYSSIVTKRGVPIEAVGAENAEDLRRAHPERSCP
ncbi:MAG: DUF1318 domain-containing protein [Alphaproteobacteria bacterium]|nr:DUF1318 domain-containing protein [Alphaproteobacteria bacterium]